MKDIFVDTNIATLFDDPPDDKYKELFVWLKDTGVLVLSQHILNEYNRHGNRLLAVLIRDLGDKDRLNRIPTKDIKDFNEDRHYHYRCNGEDIPNARAVFLSKRKLLASQDGDLRHDVNNFRKVDRIQPKAFECPTVKDIE